MYFAVLWTDTSQIMTKRRLNTFGINGELKSVGEDTQLVETGLCWRCAFLYLLIIFDLLFADPVYFLERPKIQLISTSKRRSDGSLCIVFFELNGLQHGEVDLLTTSAANQYIVSKIEFDTHDNIMAVLFFPLIPGSENCLPFGRIFCKSKHEII